jgi:hypothetical protein
MSNYNVGDELITFSEDGNEYRGRVLDDYTDGLMYMVHYPGCGIWWSALEVGGFEFQVTPEDQVVEVRVGGAWRVAM